MWICQKCGETIEDQFDACWKCNTPKGEAPVLAPDAPPVITNANPWQMTFKVFRGRLISWDALFAQVAEFASEIGSERVVNISHSADSGDGVVVVWYWTNDMTDN